LSQTWIDERLFGWSRSAKRGTSAWGGGPHDVSHAGTPDETDEEDGGDYDDVIELIPPEDDQLNSSRLRTSRSRPGSYADLQKLRMMHRSPTSSNLTQNTSRATISSVEKDSLHSSQGNRSRRMSLSDGVSVERIGAVDRQETFGEATHNINDEIRRRKPEGT
jgi:glycerol-3-phosphate O-acyltransferase/dihydroxyacetone phosphate acyltransferase